MLPKTFIVFTLTVERVVKHTCSISTIYFNRPLPSYPGQFVMLKVPEYEEIPLSLSSKRSVTVKAVGETTKYLVSIEAGSTLGVRGPFGRPFTPSEKALIVGGGIGIAPLRYLYHHLRRCGAEVRVLHGARNAEELLWRDEFENAVYATDDGSCGVKGSVVDLMRKEDLSEYERIYCCGNVEMMRRIYEIAETLGILERLEFSLEGYMRCGIGICGSCVMDNGMRVCADGPVFRGDELGW